MGLVVLGSMLSRAQAERTLEAAIAIADPPCRLRTLVALAPHVPRTARATIFRAALEILDHPLPGMLEDFGELLEYAPHAPLDLLIAVVNSTRAIKRRAIDRRTALAVVRSAAPEHTAAVVEHVLATVRTKGHGLNEIGGIAVLAGPDDRVRLVKKALAEALGVRSNRVLFETALQSLSAFARPVDRVALDAVSGTDDDSPAAHDAVERALSLAEQGSAGALVRIADRVPDPERALRIAAELPNAYDRAVALAVLCKQLPPGSRDRYVEQAIAAANTCDPTERYTALATMAHLLPHEQVVAVVDMVNEAIEDGPTASSTLTNMALMLNHLIGHPAFTMTTDDIVTIICKIHWPGERAQAMAALADHLVGASFDRLVELVRADTNLTTRALILLRLAIASGRSDLAAEALDAAAKGDHRHYYTGNTHIRALSDGTSLEFRGSPVALPYGSMRLDGAILASIGEIGTPEADAAFMAVLRREHSLDSLVEIIRDLPGPLARIVGADGVGVLIRTLLDIVRWWP